MSDETITPETLKASLLTRLQAAVELEWSTIPPYLTAWYSLPPQSNGESAAILRSVFTEEMLHMILASNVLTALGGKVRLGRENMPAYPLRMQFGGLNFGNRAFEIHLAPFSREALETFLLIEQPEQRRQPAAAFAKEHLEIPEFTVGEFYRKIMADLLHLSGQMPPDEIFSGPAQTQVGESFYWSAGGSPTVVSDLASALKALGTIAEQGEGSGDSIDDGDQTYFDQPAEVAHYYRFKEILAGRHYAPGDKPADPPSGAHFEVDFTAVYPVKPNCRAADLADEPELVRLDNLFNETYSQMITQLEAGLNGDPKTLYYGIMDGMHDLSPLARSLMQLPLPHDPDKRHAAPTFAWRRPLLG
jgi:hypothetical protein